MTDSLKEGRGYPESGTPGLAASAILSEPSGVREPVPSPAGRTVGMGAFAVPVLETIVVNDADAPALGQCVLSRWADPDFFVVLNVGRIWRTTYPVVIVRRKGSRQVRWRPKWEGEGEHETRFAEQLNRTWLHELGHAWLKPFGMTSAEEDRVLWWIQTRIWKHLEG